MVRALLESRHHCDSESGELVDNSITFLLLKRRLRPLTECGVEAEADVENITQILNILFCIEVNNMKMVQKSLHKIY